MKGKKIQKWKHLFKAFHAAFVAKGTWSSCLYKFRNFTCLCGIWLSYSSSGKKMLTNLEGKKSVDMIFKF